MVAQESDSYRYIPTVWATLGALFLPGLYLLFFTNVDVTRFYTAQVTLFFGLLFLFQWAPIQRWIVPKSVMRERTARFAREQFLAQRLHHTTDRCGVMVFISLFEHHIEIMADKGLADKVDNDYWQQTINDMTPLLRQGKTATACEVAIKAVAETMVQHAPKKIDSVDRNELPDHVIEL